MSTTEKTVLVADMPQVSPQVQTFEPLATNVALPPAVLTSDAGRQESRSSSPEFQHPEEFCSSPPGGPMPVRSRPLPVPQELESSRRKEMHDSNPYLSPPHSSRGGEPVLTDYRPKPVSYENAELKGRLETPYQDSTGQSYKGELETIVRSFHDIDPAEIDFDTKMAYQSLGEFAPPNRYEKVPSSIYNTPRSNLENEHTKCACKGKYSSAVVTLVVCTLLVALLALLVGLGGTSLAIYNFLETPESTTSEVEDLQSQLGMSQAMVVLLNSSLEELRQEMLLLATKNEAQVNELSLNLTRSDTAAKEVEQQVGKVEEQVGNVSTMVDGILDPNRPTRIQELRPYQNCTTSAIAECTITSGLFGDLPSYAACDTPRVPRYQEGQHNLDLKCAVVDPQSEGDPIITTIIVDEALDMVGCLCYVTAFLDGVNNVQCALFATRCHESFYLDTLIKLT